MYSRHLAVLVFLVLLALSTGLAQEMQGIQIGDPPPMKDVMMKNVDDRDLSIADVAGQNGTLVMFSCNSCPWVKAWEDRISLLGNSYQERGFGVIVINSNDPERFAEDSYEVMQTRAEERGFTFPYVVDASSDVARAFGATRTPEVFLFDKHSRLVYHGVIDDNAKEPENVKAHFLRDALDALIDEKEITVEETKAFGCTIKFRPES